MKPAILFCAILASALAVQPATAASFSVSFNGGSLGYSGSGTVVGSLSSPGVYSITSASGSVTDPGFGMSSIIGVDSYAGADNLLYYPNGGNYFDGNGLSFALANGVSINLFNFISGGTLFESALESNINGDIPEFVTESVGPSPTPEPGTLTLLGTSALASFGFLRRRLLA